MFDLKNAGNLIFLKEGQYLRDYRVDDLDLSRGLPNGIFNKKYPGMGATYCEFMADRPSIIVFPFRSLAFEKAQNYKKKGRNTFFVGTDPNNESTKEGKIKTWYKANKDRLPKFSVVADSIKKLVDVLKDEGCDPYTEFTLILDEVELLQMQSGFRDKLPLCFEYFKLFTSKSLVSATPLEFSDKELSKLSKYDLEVITSDIDELGNNQPRDKQRLQIERFKGSEPHVEIANKIANFYEWEWKKNKTKKFFIGINDINGINEMIEVLVKRDTKATISALVGSNSDDRILKEYNKGRIQNQRLPSNINFTTCINWSGIDIDEEIISIAISLNYRRHYSFSFENLIQFFGRSRVPQGEMPFLFALGEDCELQNFQSEYSREHRNIQLNKLLDNLDTIIDHEGDRNQIIEGLLSTKSAIYYQDLDGNPAVNWLLEDLEKYENEKINDYTDGANGLINKLKERYEVVESINEKLFDVRPEEKSQDERLEETREIFLSNLDSNYPSGKLVQRILDHKRSNDIRVAAYWYLFGKEFQLVPKDCSILAKEFSGEKYSLLVTRIIVLGLQFYTRFNTSYQDFVKKLYRQRNTHKNIYPKNIIEVIEGDAALREHFRFLLESGNKEWKASILTQHFFGVEKSQGSNPKFKIVDGILELPKLLKTYPNISQLLKEVSKLPNSKGITHNSHNPVDLIDHDFSKKS